MLLVRIVGFAIFGLGALVVWINFYTSFVRYPLHRLRGGTREDFRWVSGLPLVGSILLCLSTMFFGRSPVSWIALAIALLDTGGVLGVVLGVFTLIRMIFVRHPRDPTMEPGDSQ